MTTWMNPDDVPEEAKLVAVDGEWAVSNDPILPEVGRIMADDNGELFADPSSDEGGLPVVRRLVSFFVVLDL
jgi:hypothetical protein